MARISATEQQVLSVKASAERAYAFFSQPEQMCRAIDGVVECQALPGGKVRWVLAEKCEQGVRFQPDYVVAFDGDGARHVRWSFVEGNMCDEGEVWIDPLPSGGSQIRYRQTIEPDLPITPLLARLLKPLVVRELRSDLSRFLQRAQEQLSE